MAGTTVADGGVVEQAVRTVCGNQFDEATFVSSRGGSKFEMFERLLGPERAEYGHDAFERTLMDQIVGGVVTALPEAEGCLAALAAAGIRVCLTTGFSPPVRTALIDHLGWTELVDLALSPTANLRARPYPDLIWEGAMLLGATSAASVAVAGDTTNDLRAAANAGAGLRVAVLTGAHTEEMLRAERPTHIVDTIGRLPGIIEIDRQTTLSR
jgi:phosphonatase-like hydrolase